MAVIQNPGSAAADGAIQIAHRINLNPVKARLLQFGLNPGDDLLFLPAGAGDGDYLPQKLYGFGRLRLGRIENYFGWYLINVALSDFSLI
jgi:hypothetical protein